LRRPRSMRLTLGGVEVGAVAERFLRQLGVFSR
jgi:hypothetical protein